MDKTHRNNRSPEVKALKRFVAQRMRDRSYVTRWKSGLVGWLVFGCGFLVVGWPTGFWKSSSVSVEGIDSQDFFCHPVEGL